MQGLLVSALCLCPTKALDQDEASDLVQGLLADLIERRDFDKADPARGRFRSFLRTACEHYTPRY